MTDALPTILGLALVAAAAAFALVPFARGATSFAAPETSEPVPADRFELYRQILELEFDQQLGKISAEDYRALSAQLLGEAGDRLRDERGSAGALDEEIEREIAAARAAFAAARRPKSRRSRAKKPAETVS